jgi:hypothetical protein
LGVAWRPLQREDCGGSAEDRSGRAHKSCAVCLFCDAGNSHTVDEAMGFPSQAA